MSSTRRIRRLLSLLLVGAAAVAGVVGYRAAAASSPSGDLPAGTTAFDRELPAIARLDAALADALRRATGDATADGVVIGIRSGWRSSAEQQDLLDDAVAKYGSESEAARWVAPPSRSAHVSGDAVDVDGAGATAWLSAHGAAYGLCRIYDNEPWHYELRPDAVSSGCPPRYPDASRDPRLQ